MTPLKLAPEYEDWLVTAMQRGADDEFWAANNIVDNPGRYKDIPVYLVSGWYDSWAGNTTANYRALQPQIKGPVYLIMGPWIHGGQGDFAHGQVSFGRDAAIADQWAWRKEWYDHWLKGMENSVGRSAPFATPVRIFVMGTGDGGKDERGRLRHGGSWRDEHEWPLERTQYTDFYLHRGGELSTQRPTEHAGFSDFVYDPRNPVPTIGGNISSGNDIMLQGAWDQRGGRHVWNFPEPVPLSARNDILVFQTAPLAHDVEMTGEIEVRLYVLSSAPDTDFTAKLLDVYPPSADWPGGFDLNIGDGIVRARFRESLKQEKLMEPGKLHELTIRLYPTSNVFKKGHRLRLDISSSNFPRFDINPNTGEPLNEHRRVASARQRVFHSAEHPSRIILPVIGPAPRAAGE
jgi:putative CocE/NonD family hydrolase